MIHLTISGRDARTLVLYVDQIESYATCHYDESYERDANSRIRTKSGAEYLVRETIHDIAKQIGNVALQ